MSKNWSHPHEEFNLTDNTGVVITNSVNNGDVLFQGFISEGGEDSKILDFDDYYRVLADYGNPNMNVYGQSYYQVLNWLENGGRVKGIRLTAKDARPANLVVMLNINTVAVQKTDSDGNLIYLDPTTQLETTISVGTSPVMIDRAIVSHSLETFNALPSDNLDIRTLLKSKMTTDANGTHIPLFCISCKGRGIYGNKFRFRITPTPMRDKSDKYRYYYLEFFKNQNGLNRIDNSPIVVSNSPESLNSSKLSEYIEDAVARQSAYPVKVVALDEGYYKAVNMLLPLLKVNYPSIEAKDIDLYCFKDRNQNVYKGFDIAPTSASFDVVTGLGLESGTDGEFAISNPNRDDAITARFKDLFNGAIDASINDSKEQKFRLSLDANYPSEVKAAMIAWRNSENRDDHVAVIDSSILFTVEDLKAVLSGKNSIGANEYGVVINTQNFDTYDKYTGRYITVTTNYLWSILFAKHCIKSSHVPFGGLSIPLNGYIAEGSLRPVLSKPEDKTAIYDLRGNYIEKENGTYMFGTNLTSQDSYSDLSYENNAFTTYEIKEALKSLSALYRFKYIDSDADLSTLNKYAADKVAPFKDSKCKAIKANVIRDSSDPLEKTVRVICSAGFRDFDLNVIIDTSIDKY